MVRPVDELEDKLYPHPTLVVGVGRFGLGVLERLAEDWRWQEAGNADFTRRNLRLLSVQPAAATEAAKKESWRTVERPLVHLADSLGAGALPTQALDFVLLRCLGMIRYYDGAYEFGMPKDLGFFHTEESENYRRRVFQWLRLDADPIRAIERFQEYRAGNAMVEAFAGALIERARLGHSPRAVLCILARVKAMSQGYDPSPWHWARQRDASKVAPEWLSEYRSIDQSWEPAATPHGTHPVTLRPLDELKLWIATVQSAESGTPLSVYDEAAQKALQDKLAATAEGFERMELPESLNAGMDYGQPGDVGGDDLNALRIDLPSCFADHPLQGSEFAQYLHTPVDPRVYLKENWGTSDWLSNNRANSPFLPLPLSLFRLGMYDHLPSDMVDQATMERFTRRIAYVAHLASQGLRRMWLDLERDPGWEHVYSGNSERRRSGELVECIQQTLDLLGDQVIKPYLDPLKDEQTAWENADEADISSDPWVDGGALTSEPSHAARSLIVDDRQDLSPSLQALSDRLADLGIDSALGGQQLKRPLLHQVTLSPSDLDRPTDKLPSGGLTSDSTSGVSTEGPGLLQLRKQINDEFRHLYHFGFLTQYWKGKTREPPRMKVFVVADLREVMARVSLRTIMRELCAEAHRALGPIFDFDRGGLSNAISVVPTLWLPHPSDAIAGREPRSIERNRQETVVLDSLHSLRRWLQTVPREERCVRQIYVNGRVSSNAVVGNQEALKQTRDFIRLSMHGNLESEPTLSELDAAAAGGNYYASFACHEVDFPELRTREYLANRLNRDVLERLRGWEDAPVSEPEPVETKSREALTAAAQEQLKRRTKAAADAIKGEVSGQLSITRETDPAAINDAFDDALEDSLRQRITSTWLQMCQPKGEMRESMQTLRQQVHRDTTETLEQRRSKSDDLVTREACTNGLDSVRVKLHGRARMTEEALLSAEEQRTQQERNCEKHASQPGMQAINRCLADVQDAADKKPAWRPILFALAAIAVVGPWLMAPVIWTITTGLGLDAKRNAIEFLLGPMGPIIGAGLLLAAVYGALSWYVDKYVRIVNHRVAALAKAAAKIVHDEGDGITSVFKFLDVRLQFTGAVAVRSHHDQLNTIADREERQANRIVRAVDLQIAALRRKAEHLGVRCLAKEDVKNGHKDDLQRLFSTRWYEDPTHTGSLVHPDIVQEYYLDRFGDPRAVEKQSEQLVEGLGSMHGWRDRIAFGDLDAVMDHGRDQFQTVVQHPVFDQPAFQDAVSVGTSRFLNVNYANTGFGADFDGREGIDPDGIRVLAKATLVMHKEFIRDFADLRKTMDPPPAAGLKTLAAPVRPNSLYLLSAVTGLSANTVRNLHRYESQLDLREPSNQTMFPYSAEMAKAENGPIHIFSGWLTRKSLPDSATAEPTALEADAAATDSPDATAPQAPDGGPAAAPDADGGDNGGSDA